MTEGMAEIPEQEMLQMSQMSQSILNTEGGVPPDINVDPGSLPPMGMPNPINMGPQMINMAHMQHMQHPIAVHQLSSWRLSEDDVISIALKMKQVLKDEISQLVEQQVLKDEISQLVEQ